MCHLKAVLQLEGPSQLVAVQPSGGVGRLCVCRGDREEEVGGVGSTGESGRKCLRSRHPHLRLLQPALLQPHSQGENSNWLLSVLPSQSVSRLCDPGSVPSPQDQSDIQIECYAEDQLFSQRFCNISSPFMKSLAQVGALND